MFKSGFVNIIGNPNVGKSTLMNALMGESLCITSYKPQTTRHRIQGILTTDKYQIVFSDTPGFIEEASYKLHEKMNRYVNGTFEDADLMLFVTNPNEKFADDHHLLKKLKQLTIPVYLILNKQDLFTDDELILSLNSWQQKFEFEEFVPVSALQATNTGRLLKLIIGQLNEGPQYYPDDQISNRNMRFFVSEMIREQVFLRYREEIPYSTEVMVEEFKQSERLVRIQATIFVNRKTQKSILIGKGGLAIKGLGIDARKRIEEFVRSKVHLELFVKVRENWRNDDKHLNQLGYQR